MLSNAPTERSPLQLMNCFLGSRREAQASTPLPLASPLTPKAPKAAVCLEQDSVPCPVYPFSPLLLEKWIVRVSPFYRSRD